MPKKRRPRATPATKRIAEALSILKAIGVPREQQNERSALTLLALLGITPTNSWAEASDALLGITEMMDYFRIHFRKRYAPNTRETVRRQTVHQFIQMGLVVANPDDPARSVNSPDNRYKIDPSLKTLVQAFGSEAWTMSLKRFLATADGLQRLRPREREMRKILVTLPDGAELKLTEGGQNVLVKPIIEEFCPRFAAGGVLVYCGDAGHKQLLFNAAHLKALGVVIDEHGKMPDVVVHLPAKKWLILIEAVTSHGPVNIKRHNELKDLFKGSKAGLVFVTAFLNRKAMTKYLGEIAWETEVWVADNPSHMIHFNGERFLGPY